MNSNFQFQNVVDPDKGTLDNIEDDDFIPDEKEILDAEDGGSSEEDLDKDEMNESDEDEVDLITDGQADIQGVPSVLAQAYKKRFPNFWRTQQNLA